MPYELSNTTNVLLNEIEMPETTRNTLAKTYALALRSNDTTDWAAVNRAIIKRWSLSALEYIKERAHKIAIYGGVS